MNEGLLSDTSPKRHARVFAGGPEATGTRRNLWHPDVMNSADREYTHTKPQVARTWWMLKVRLFLVICGTFVCLASAAQQTTTHTYTFDPQFFYDPSYCEGGGCPQSTCPKPFSYNLGTFNDPLPPSAKLRYASFSWKTGNDKSFSYQVVPQVTIFLDGTALGAQDITNYAVCSPGTAQIASGAGSGPSSGTDDPGSGWSG